MASPNNQTIPIIVKSTDHGYNCAYVITQGDANAYTLTITYTDITAFDGTVTLRFVMPDGTYHDRDDSDGVAVSGNVITYTMAEADYAQRGMVCYVRHLDSPTLHTTLKITFSRIRTLEGETVVTVPVSYPTWAADMRDLDFAIGTVETLDPGADATASITGDVPDKVLNLGIPQGVQGDAATVEVGTVTTLAPGASATVGNSGATGAAVLDFGIPAGATGPANTLAIGTVTTVAAGGSATATVTGDAPNQTLNLGIPQGVKGDKGDTGDAGAAGTIDNTTISTLSGILAGNGSNVAVATAAQAAAQPMTDPANLYDSDTTGGQLQEVKGDLDTVEAFAMRRNARYYNRPAAYKIKVAAGRFNMSWNNTSGRLWIFPAGTVQYSDGTTPISTSTAEKPDVVIPAGGGYVWLGSAMWNGLYTLNDNDTDAILTGSLADLPPLTNFLSLNGCSLVTGALSDLPPLTYYLRLTNCSLVTGSLSDLPPLTYTLSLSNCSLVTGSLSDLPPLTNTLSLSNCSLVTGAYTAVSGTNVPTTTNLAGTGLSATDMDATLIAYAACTKTGGTFTATGKNRTTASDAAVLHLTTPTGSGGLGWAVTGLTVV